MLSVGCWILDVFQMSLQDRVHRLESLGFIGSGNRFCKIRRTELHSLRLGVGIFQARQVRADKRVAKNIADRGQGVGVFRYGYIVGKRDHWSKLDEGKVIYKAGCL